MGTPTKPVIIIDQSLLAGGIILIIIAVAILIGMIQHSSDITTLANQSTPEIAHALYDDLSNFLFVMRIEFVVLLGIGGFLVGLGSYRLRKKGAF